VHSAIKGRPGLVFPGSERGYSILIATGKPKFHFFSGNANRLIRLYF
jgi:hypothetical protein